jgi:hypothetical protein
MDFQVVVATVGALLLGVLALLRQRASEPAPQPVRVRVEPTRRAR